MVRVSCVPQTQEACSEGAGGGPGPVLGQRAGTTGTGHDPPPPPSWRTQRPRPGEKSPPGCEGKGPRPQLGASRGGVTEATWRRTSTLTRRQRRPGPSAGRRWVQVNASSQGRLPLQLPGPPASPGILQPERFGAYGPSNASSKLPPRMSGIFPSSPGRCSRGISRENGPVSLARPLPDPVTPPSYPARLLRSTHRDPGAQTAVCGLLLFLHQLREGGDSLAAGPQHLPLPEHPGHSMGICRVDGWTDGRVDGRTNERMNEHEAF